MHLNRNIKIHDILLCDLFVLVFLLAIFSGTSCISIRPIPLREGLLYIAMTTVPQGNSRDASLL